MSQRWVTFDCYGTLVDWRAGFSMILCPFAGERTEELMRVYHRFERELEIVRPFRAYREVLTQGLRLAADFIGLSLTTAQASSLARQWGRLPVFRDVAPALEALRRDGYRLGVLTNCDDDLFAETQQVLSVPLDAVVTAQRVKDYKPSLSHFEFFTGRWGVDRGNWVHVGCSWFHDIVPARQLGIHRIWLDREGSGDDPRAASVRIFSAKELGGTVAGLMAGPGR